MSDLKAKKSTDRISISTGKPYPRCQHMLGELQCDKSTYADGLCWVHYSRRSTQFSIRKAK